MSVVAICAAVGVGAGAAGVAGVIRPPSRRLAGRVRPYTLAARSALGHLPDPVVTDTGGNAGTTTLARLFLPPMRAGAARISRMIEARGDDHLDRMLRQAGVEGVTPERYRVQQVTRAALIGGGSALAVALTLRMPLMVLAAAVAGFVLGASRARARLERLIADRAARIRLELYTVNHLLAMQVRTGSGAMQSVQRVVARGSGAVVDELAEVLTWTRAAWAKPRRSAARPN